MLAINLQVLMRFECISFKYFKFYFHTLEALEAGLSPTRACEFRRAADTESRQRLRLASTAELIIYICIERERAIESILREVSHSSVPYIQYKRFVYIGGRIILALSTVYLITTTTPYVHTSLA
jgi:hypothetical protein